VSEMDLPERSRALIEHAKHGDRSMALALHALIIAADADGCSDFNQAAIIFRDDHLAAMRADGRDAEREAGRLSLDEVRKHLAASVLPRLVSDGVIILPQTGLNAPDARIRIADVYWRDILAIRRELAAILRQTGEHLTPAKDFAAIGPIRRRPKTPAAKTSVLEASGLIKIYRRRKVVNDVALRLQQGEIVGLLGPNGAGKTTTFYMIVGLIQPFAGRISMDGEDITTMPMYKRARRGVGYLSQEPSIFRKLSVEDNILAILETLPISNAERRKRLETLLDELSIKHLRESKAFALSGGERRRLEITRALVTRPKFMMLDEPFAGVDPIAVHDIQSIVANLRHRGIGVLISDHNVEQTLDIVDRAYIMFDGQVKVSGTVRELVFDDTVADIYLGPTLTARLRARFSSTDGNGHAAGDGNGNSSKRHDDRLDELNGSGGGEVQ
jgi:lipopolysaccharide export system ATP-binding protein